MLDEKKTAAALKTAWRGGGYRFVLSNGILSVRTDQWGFQAALSNVPAKVLGLITEHLGAILEDGDAFLLKKDSAEQSLMLDQEASTWTKMRGYLDSSGLASMQRTPLSWNNLEIWQDQKTLKTMMMDPDDTRIIDTEFLQDGLGAQEWGIILWKSMGGSVAYVFADPAEDGLEHLDGFPWCGEGG